MRYLTMESFKVYLPSNACANIYPNNTSSDYKTRFDHIIKLDGEWEVGVESIFYSSHIENNTKSNVHCDVRLVKRTAVNDNKPFKFLLSDEGKWKGLTGIKPAKFEEDPNKMNNVLNTLVKMNKLMVEGRKILFMFTRNGFASELKPFYIQITPRLAEVLGYNYNIFGKVEEFSNDRHMKPGKEKLIAEDYLIKYFYPDVQHKVARIVFKARGMTFKGGKRQFLKLWRLKMEQFTALKTHFKNMKVVVDNFSVDSAIIFSPDFGKLIGHELPIIGKGTTWASRKAKLEKGYVAEEWYIDIYSSDLEFTEKRTDFQLSLEVYPKQHQTIKDLMSHINLQMQKQLKEKLKTDYDANKHHFELSLASNGYSELVRGSNLNIDFSQDLHSLFAIPKRALQQAEANGTRHIGNEIHREQQLFLLSNVAKYTAYAQQHLPILRSFLHPNKKTNMIKKRFDPIVYLPVMSNSIDMIQLQLADDSGKAIKLSDTKTLVCLYFRKVREKSMM